MVFAILYTPLVLINLPAGLAVWIALVFIEHLPVLDVGPTAASLLVLAGWAGTIGSRRSLAQPFAKSARFLPAAVGLLLAWLSLALGPVGAIRGRAASPWSTGWSQQ